MSPHLVIGASGQVGEQIVRTVEAAGYQAVGTYNACAAVGARQLDIRDRAAVGLLIKQVRPSVVYLAASLTNVDYCELHPEEGYAINVLGVRNVVEAANEVGAKLVYFSSDYIFDGKTGPHREEAPANPICVYGTQKLIAEQHVALHAADGLIVRTTVVYGWERQGKNFLYRLLNTLKDRRTLKVPVDQVGSPTHAPNLAQAVVELTLNGASGVYHVAGPVRVSRYEFAREAARLFGLDSGLIAPVTTLELKQPAPRPLEAGMIVDKAAAQLTTVLVGYPEGLRAMAGKGG